MGAPSETDIFYSIYIELDRILWCWIWMYFNFSSVLLLIATLYSSQQSQSIATILIGGEGKHFQSWTWSLPFEWWMPFWSKVAFSISHHKTLVTNSNHSASQIMFLNILVRLWRSVKTLCYDFVVARMSLKCFPAEKVFVQSGPI